MEVKGKLKILTHNQVVPGSSPGGPTNKALTNVVGAFFMPRFLILLQGLNAYP